MLFVRIIFVTACFWLGAETRFVELKTSLDGTPGENLTDEFRYSTGVEILNSCESCLLESKVSFDFKFYIIIDLFTTGLWISAKDGERLDWICVNPDYLLRPSSEISQAVVALVCDLEFCGHEHLSVPFDISSLVCESRYPFPQYLRNLALHFTGFPALAYSSYMKTKELQLKACRDAVQESSGCGCYQSTSTEEVESPTTTDVPPNRRYRDPIWRMALSK